MYKFLHFKFKRFVDYVVCNVSLFLYSGQFYLETLCLDFIRQSLGICLSYRPERIKRFQNRDPLASC